MGLQTGLCRRPKTYRMLRTVEGRSSEAWAGVGSSQGGFAFPESHGVTFRCGLEPWASAKGTCVFHRGPPWVVAGPKAGLCGPAKTHRDLEAIRKIERSYLRNCLVMCTFTSQS